MSDAGEKVFRVPEELVQEPLTTALKAWLPGHSWGQVRRLLETHRVTVSGNLCTDEGRRLKLGEVVKVLAEPLAGPPSDDDVIIRHVDPHLVVVEKPAGMTTIRHPEERNWPKRRRQLQPTLDEVLPRILQKRMRRKPGAPPPSWPKIRPVHRLDRETSGLMVFARTIDAERGLGMQFRAHALDRTYLAIVSGTVTEQTIASDLIDDRGDGRRGSTPFPNQGKHAVTHVIPLEVLGAYTLVQCRLETGRTHQIRIHLAELGHPLCGDKVYRGPFGKPFQNDKSRAPRLALHACELAFEHPITGDWLEFEMALPGELETFLHRLRKEAGLKGRQIVAPVQLVDREPVAREPVDWNAADLDAENEESPDESPPRLTKSAPPPVRRAEEPRRGPARPTAPRRTTSDPTSRPPKHTKTGRPRAAGEPAPPRPARPGHTKPPKKRRP